MDKVKALAIFHKHHDPYQETFDGDRLPGCKYEMVIDEISKLECEDCKRKDEMIAKLTAKLQGRFLVAELNAKLMKLLECGKVEEDASN